MAKRFELVSLALCPYVQRSVITLKHKKIDYTLTPIEFDALPEWFDKVSPLGKVPVLLVREPGAKEPVAIFESAVINEYLDEVTPPALLPRDPLAKAYERAWVAVSGDLLMSAYTMMTSKDAAELAEAQKETFEILGRVEEALPGGRYFTGDKFSLVDAAFAPFFMRVLMFKNLRADNLWARLPKTRKWAESLLELPEVRDSVAPDFKERFVAYLENNGGAWASQATR